jgi:hypothetical protein
MSRETGSGGAMAVRAHRPRLTVVAIIMIPTDCTVLDFAARLFGRLVWTQSDTESSGSADLRSRERPNTSTRIRGINTLTWIKQTYTPPVHARWGWAPIVSDLVKEQKSSLARQANLQRKSSRLGHKWGKSHDNQPKIRVLWNDSHRPI